MTMRTERIGFALCGSFCTHKKALDALQELRREYKTVIPILSDACLHTDTRFGSAQELFSRLEELTGETPITSIKEAEPIGPKKLLDALVVLPCTGNTLAKLAAGIADTAVTMAVKSHLRNERPVILAVSTNDGLGVAARNIGELLSRRNLYFVPFGQDDPEKKPRSLVADFTQVNAALSAALEGRQLQPMLV